MVTKENKRTLSLMTVKIQMYTQLLYTEIANIMIQRSQ